MGKLKTLFDKHADEYLEFLMIPDKDRMSNRPDLCALLYLEERLGAENNVLSGLYRDRVYLNYDKLERLTEKDVIYLLRCGVLYDEESLHLSP